MELSRVFRELRDAGMFKMIVDKNKHFFGEDVDCQHFSECVSPCFQDNVNRLEFHMDKCHRMLEVVEGRLTSHLRQREEERIQKLSKSRKELDGKMTRLEQLLKAAEWQLENTDEENMDNMMEEMKEEYGRHGADDQKVIYPYVGLVCAGPHAEDGKFYRAQVIQLMQEERMMVRLVLVDIGFCQMVHYSSLRRIGDNFLALPAMASRVNLAGVRPLANKYVKEIVINKMVRMTLQDMKTGVEDECKMMMFKLKDTQGFSINTMIVKKGNAIATTRTII